MQLFRLTVVLLFPLLLFWSGSATPVHAQAMAGVVSGTVTDANGAPAPNISVTVENIGTGARYQTSTDNSGRFQLAGVTPGRYRIINVGSATVSQELEVSAAGLANVTLSLPSGPRTDTVVSQISTPERQTETAQIFSNFNTRNVQYQPQPNYFSPTATSYGAYNLGLLPAGVIAAGGPVVGGQSPTSNNFRIDGIDNNSRLTSRPLVYVSNEATTEFLIAQNPLTPDQGHVTGGQFTSIIRTGTNRAHGQIYDYLQNRNLNAIDRRFANAGYGDLPKYDQNRLGASFGTPIIPNHLFFFGNFEYNPLSFEGLANGGAAFAPTAQGYSALNAAGVNAGNLRLLSNGLGTSNFATQTITVNGRAIPIGPAGNLTRTRQEQYFGTGAIDWNLANKDQLHLRYVHNYRDTNNAGNTLGFFQSPQANHALVASASHYHTFFSKVTNELRFGYNRFSQDFTNNAVNSSPLISISDVNLSLGPNFGPYGSAYTNTYHVADNATVNVHGGHNIQFGVDALRYINSLGNAATGNGVYGYSTLQRFLLDLPPDVQNQRSFNNASVNGNQWDWFAFIKDRWRVSQSFTVDLGVKYQYVTVPLSLRRQNLNDVASVSGVLDFGKPEDSQYNFAPNVGIAWSPGLLRGFVFRSGFGMNYDTLYNSFNNLSGFSGAPQLGANIYGSLLGTAPGFLASGGLRNPYPFNVDSNNLSAAQARALTTSYVGNLKLPYALQWNAALEGELYRGFVVEVKYLGSRGRHLPYYSILNAPAELTAANSLPLYYSAPTQAQLNQLPVTLNGLRAAQVNPLAQYGFTNPISTVISGGSSEYHALAVQVRHRFTGGFQFQGAYTWSRLIDDVTGGFQTANRAGDRGNSAFDRRQRATATLFWEPTALFSSTYSVVRNVFANLALGGTFTYQTPQYGTAYSGSDAGLSGFGTNSRAIYNPNGTAGVGSGVTPLFNSQGQVVAYQATNPNAQYIAGAPGLLTNGQRNTLELGRINNFDVFAVKRFSYGDRFGIELRGDAYNVFNHAQYTGDPIRALYAPEQAGVPSLFIPGTAGFGNVNSFYSSNPRLLQVALRLTF